MWRRNKILNLGHSFIRLFNMHLLSTYYVLSTGLGIGGGRDICLQVFHSQWEGQRTIYYKAFSYSFHKQILNTYDASDMVCPRCYGSSTDQD